jgi:hypothetical protein
MSVDRALPAAHDPRSRFSLGVAIVGLAGVAGIFLPFTFNVSPLDAAGTLPFLRGDEHFLARLWRLGVPLFLAILVTVGTFRRIVLGPLTRTELVVGYLAALVADCCFLCLYLPYGNDDPARAPSSFSEWFMFLVSWVGSAAGAYLLWRNLRRGVSHAANVISAMQIVYAIVAVFCMVAFASEGWQIGAYLVAVTTLVYLVQIVAVSVAAPGQTALAPK